jgi:anaerobic magnesium-protoporphyrin IX monomethyl ester cyclase
VKVCLVTPPSPFLLDQRVFMSLGILKVGAVLEDAGVTVDHLDLTGVENFGEAAKDYSGADMYAITATTPQIPAAVEVRRALGGKAILGGPHATLVHAAAKRGNERARKAMNGLLSEFDVVVAGDGEKAIFEALHTRGLVDADDPKSVLWQTSKDFTESPWPARHLVDVSSYHYSVDGHPALSLVGQLGCPFACNFCGGRNSAMLRRIRSRSADNVVAEMVHLHNTYGVTGAMFYDDELNVNRGLLELLRKIKATGIDWRLRGFVKSELFDEEQAEAFYDAGFRWLLCGFEAAHPRILRNINKKATVEDNTRMLRTAHTHGLKVKALMSAGHPAESPESMYAIRDWLIQKKPDDFDLTTITEYPGTGYYDESVHIGDGVYRFEVNGDALYSEDVDFTKQLAYYKGGMGNYQSFVWTDYIDRHEIVRLRDEIERDVRSTLNIPYPSSATAVNFEHSMGMNLPPSILRSTKQ